MRLTEKMVSSLKGNGKDQFFRDDDLRGFVVKVTATGKVSFVVDARIRHGKVKRVKLGDHPILTVQQARERARTTLDQLRQGKDPHEEERLTERLGVAQKAKDKALSVTLEDLLDQFFAARQLKPKTEYDYRNTINRWLGDWKLRSVREITRKMVEDKYGEIESKAGRSDSERGLAQANKTMRILSSVLTYGMGEEIVCSTASKQPSAARLVSGDATKGERLLSENPVDVLKRRRTCGVPARTGSVHPQDLWMLLDALESRDHVVRDWLMVLLFTGMRREEALSLKWEQVDWDKKWVTLVDTKNGLTHVLPMSDEVEQVLRKRWGIRDKMKPEQRSEWVFNVAMERVINPRVEIDRVIEDSTVVFTPHDLRRTFASVAFMIGLDHTTIKRVMNHKSGDITERYIQTRTEQMRKPVQEIADYITWAYQQYRSEWIERVLGKDRWSEYYM